MRNEKLFLSLHKNLREDNKFPQELMRRYWISWSAMLLLFASCGGNKANNTEEMVVADSMTLNDSVAVLDSIAAEFENTPVPKAADELFDDFFFNFAVNKKLQMERIVFPLKSVNGPKTTEISKNEWKMDYFFTRQGYYTLLFDNEKQMEVVKDTTVSRAVVEKIYFNTKSIIQYVFERRRGAWMMTGIHTVPISTSNNASFLDFYHRFATDSEFQAESLGETVQFVGPDPDDDFSMMEGIITRDTWEAFAPQLPTKMIYNIVYGTPHKEAETKMFVLRGIANGLELEMKFRKSGGHWKLTKLTT